MNIIINEELRSFIDPLTAVEYEALERSLLREGCRDALVLWNDVLIDGHNRHAICTHHNIPFRTVQNDSFHSIEDVMLWVIDNHLARRSVSDFQRGLLALRKKEIVSTRLAERAEREAEAKRQGAEPPADPTPPWNTREDVAKAARVSSNTISQIERIKKEATPQLVEAVRSGTISINAAANVATLPKEVQIAAVAEGKKQLQQLAREVREQKAGSRPKKERAEPEDSDSAPEAEADELAVLRRRVAELTAENATLKQQLSALGG